MTRGEESRIRQACVDPADARGPERIRACLLREPGELGVAEHVTAVAVGARVHALRDAKLELFATQAGLFWPETPLVDCERPLFDRERPLFGRKTALFRRETSLSCREMPLLGCKTPIFASQSALFEALAVGQSIAARLRRCRRACT